MKSFLAISLIFAVVSATPKDLCTKNDDHSLQHGTKCTTIVLELSFWKPATISPYPEENIKTISFPESGTLKNSISFIQVINKMVNEDDGGCPNIVNGGLGQNFVELELRSQRGKDMKFLVVICTDP